MTARAGGALAAIGAWWFLSAATRAAAPPNLDTCTLTSRPVVAAALGARVRDVRRLSANGACQFRTIGVPGHAPSVTIAERAGDRAYIDAYVKNAHAELNVDPAPLPGLGEIASHWPGNVAVLRHRRFALVTILGMTGAGADRAALTIARDVAKRL